MSAVLDTLNALPKELWTPLGVVAAGLLGALIAIAGVMLQNHGASRNWRTTANSDDSNARRNSGSWSTLKRCKSLRRSQKYSARLSIRPRR